MKSLDESGLFLIRGAVEYVAQALDVTRFTIYNYRKTAQASEELAEQPTPGTQWNNSTLHNEPFDTTSDKHTRKVKEEESQ